jgi:WhiB family transcriptional regulator, redox-sensing transcriptional regulator
MQGMQPRPLADDWDWQYQAACKGMDTEIFFYTDRERGPKRERRERIAKSICASCPVINKCREQALRLAEPYGIWGGLTEEERMEILNKKLNKINLIAG